METRSPFNKAKRLIQFSIFSDNKVGRLSELVNLLSANDLHFIAVSSIDMNDITILRIVVNYSDYAREIFLKNRCTFRESEVVAVEIDSEHELKNITCALVQAEINIYYIYSFLMRPNGKTGLVLGLEDNDLAEDIFRKNQIRILHQNDIAR
jgi:hypothetical protein